MEQMSSDRLRRELAEAIRRVIAGQRIELTSYGKSLGVALVPLADLPEAGTCGKRLAADG